MQTVALSPVQDALSLDEVKQHLHVEIDEEDQDSVISGLISAATQVATDFTGRALTETTYKVYGTCFSGKIYLPHPPLLEIVSVEYYNTENVLTALTSEFYKLDLWGVKANVGFYFPSAVPELYYRSDAVVVTYKAGYGTGEGQTQLPAPIKQAMLLMIGDWFEKREDALYSIPRVSERLMWPYRVDII